MKVLHISNSDSIGGAARAAYRLHIAQLALGIESRMLVRKKTSDHWTISGPLTKFEKVCNLLRSPIGGHINKWQRSNNINFHSSGWLPSHWSKKINNSDIDVVNLHWVADETMSIEDIGRIKKPIVWTLHDMWPFCGTEHVTGYDENARWKTGYSSKNRDKLEQGIDLDKLAWLRKKKAWKKQYMHIVAPSNWMAECAKNSILFKDYPITIIPNALDTDIYKPLDKFFCRNLLNLPLNKTIILFGAMGGGKDPNKGFDLLIASLNYLSQKIDNKKIMCLIFGQSKPQEFTNLPFETRWLGHVHDDTTLCSIYNAADIMIVPSRTENLPQAATEAHSCGTPVVAFNTTGLKDIVTHLQTGYLATPFEPFDMCKGIEYVINGQEKNHNIATNAREKSINSWSPNIIVKKYLNVYLDIMRQQSVKKAK